MTKILNYVHIGCLNISDKISTMLTVINIKYNCEPFVPEN